MYKKLALAAAVAACSSVASAAPSVSLRAMTSDLGEQVTSSANVLRMSGNGRFMLYKTDFDTTDQIHSQLYLTDLKTDKTTAISPPGQAIPNEASWGVSDNGHYLAYWTISEGLKVVDRATGATHDLVQDPGLPSSTIKKGRLFVSNDGKVVYSIEVLDTDTRTWSAEVYTADTNTGSHNTLIDFDENFEDIDLGDLSADGKMLAFTGKLIGDLTAEQTYMQAYLLDLEAGTLQLKSVREDGSANFLTSKMASLSANAKYLVISYASPHFTVSEEIEIHDIENNSLQTVRLRDYDVDNIGADGDSYGGIDISKDGNYITFHAALWPSHPDYEASGEKTRIFRLDRTKDELIVVSVTNSGEQPDSFMNAGTYVSRDGRLVGFASNAKNLLDIEPISTEEPYAATIGDFSSEYLFVGMPNSDQNWKHLSSMDLVADNTWEGKLYFDGQGSNEFKFDVGGFTANGVYVPTQDWELNFGDANNDGVADQNAGNIAVVDGAGFYRITFNDQSLEYSVSKMVTPVDGVNVNFTCNNGNTYFGQSVYAVGNIPELGDWDVASAIKLDTSNYPTWSRSITVPQQSDIEWKCVKRDEQNPNQGIEWQEGDNNMLDAILNSDTTGAF